MAKKTEKTLFILSFSLILAIGIFARVWQFNQIPAGIHQDEAGQGVDAFDILHFGIDRNGTSYPLEVITWGDGDMILYGYLALPFIALMGLTTMAIRMPNLIAGILILPLLYLLAERLIDRKFGLIAMFFVAICPWNIIGARFSLWPFLLPFVFCLAVYFLLLSENKKYWLIPSIVCFALCLFTYSTAIVAVPLFLLMIAPLIARKLHLSGKFVAAAGALFLLLVSPVILYVLINTFKLPAIHLGALTIPSLPREARFLSQTTDDSGLRLYWNNLNVLLKTLWTGSDNWPRNSVDPYGALYPGYLLVMFAGLVILFRKYGKKIPTWAQLLLAWIAACLPIGVLQATNINRICLIFIPIMLFMAYFVYEVSQKVPLLALGFLAIYLVGFIMFTREYHGPVYDRLAAKDFNYGILEAVDYVSAIPKYDVCVSPKIGVGYIYILFEQKPDPSTYIRKGYPIDEGHPFKLKSPLYRYKFHDNLCSTEKASIHLNRVTDPAPMDGFTYEMKSFDQFVVYVPK